MEFIKILWKNKRIAWKLGKSDFKNRFANTFSLPKFQVNKETSEISYDKKSTLITQTELKILELL